MKAIFFLAIVCLMQVFANVAGRVIESDSPFEKEWNDYKLKFKKTYSNEREELQRKSVWIKNFLYLRDFKQHIKQSYTIDLNEFSDFRTSELVSGKVNVPKHNTQALIESYNMTDIPKTFDWRTQGVIGPVKDQGALGSVFAFVTEECAQSLHAIQTKNLLDLSIPQVVDCCPQPDNPFDCLSKTSGGLCSAQDYPQSVGQCKNCTIVAPIKGSYQVKKGDENDLQQALLQAPVFVYVDASQPSFQMYTGGIYADKNCSPASLDHALQLVGYGIATDGTEYWICRNSWGVAWGQKGYINIKKGLNMCGIASYALLPL